MVRFKFKICVVFIIKSIATETLSCLTQTPINSSFRQQSSTINMTTEIIYETEIWILAWAQTIKWRRRLRNQHHLPHCHLKNSLLKCNFMKHSTKVIKDSISQSSLVLGGSGQGGHVLNSSHFTTVSLVVYACYYMEYIPSQMYILESYLSVAILKSLL